MKRILPILFLPVFALGLDGEPDGVAPESNAGLYVSTIDGVFLPRTLGLNGASWTPILAVDGAASGNTRNFTLNTVADGSGSVFSGTVSYAIVDDSTVTASWRMTPSADVRLNALTVGFKTPVTLFAGGKVSLGSGMIDIPTQKLEQDNEFVHAPTRVFELYDTDGVRRLRIDFGAEVWATVQDNRRWTEQVLEIRFQKPNAARNGSLKDFSRGTTYAFDYTIALTGDGVVDLGSEFVARAGADWIPLAPMGWVEPGSALDFSAFPGLPGEAGRHGRVVRRGDHFEFEGRPGEPQRFYGVNLCYSTARPRANEVALAQNLQRIGYNAVRLHHVDFELTYGQGAAYTNLQAWGTGLFDRLVAACVTNGLYLTTDVYTGRENVPWRELGVDRDGVAGVQGYKRMLLASEPAVSNLLDFARNFFGHVNPYTGRTLAQEPAMIGISLVNEDSISPLASPQDLCAEIPPLAPLWRSWIAAKKAADPAAWADASSDPPSSMDRFFLRFLEERREALLARIAAVLRDELGCRAPFSDLNGIQISLSDLAARGALLDYADDHIYYDHPTFLGGDHNPPTSLPNDHPFRGAALGVTPYAAFRLADRPYTITEFNFTAPGKYRAAGGLSMGATAALQDWSGVWRFDWGSGDAGTPWTQTMAYFCASGDPIQQLSERVASALFLRRDIEPLGPSLVARLPTAVAAGPHADARLQIAAPWRWAGWFARLGYVVGDAVPAGAADLGAHPAASSLSDAAVRAALGLGDALPSNAFGTIGAGGAVVASGTTGAFGVATPRTAGVYAPGGTMEAGPLSATLSGGAASVAAMSVDGRPLAQSNRILVTHLTDAVDTGMTFSNESRTVLKAWGETPHLMRAGTADVRLVVDAGPSVFEVWSLALDGTRRGKVASSVENGTLRFSADVAADPSRATFLYEIVRAAYPVPVFADERKDGAKPVAFAADGSVFRVTIRNATAGGLYTAYVADAPGGPFSPLASSAKRASADGLLSLDVPAGPSARFVRVGVGN